MKAEIQKIINLFEELEEASETAFLTLSTKGGKTTIKLQLESPPSPSPPSISNVQTLQPASGRRRRHREAGGSVVAALEGRAASVLRWMALTSSARMCSADSFCLSPAITKPLRTK